MDSVPRFQKTLKKTPEHWDFFSSVSQILVSENLDPKGRINNVWTSLNDTLTEPLTQQSWVICHDANNKHWQIFQQKSQNTEQRVSPQIFDNKREWKVFAIDFNISILVENILWASIRSTHQLNWLATEIFGVILGPLLMVFSICWALKPEKYPHKMDFLTVSSIISNFIISLDHFRKLIDNLSNWIWSLLMFRSIYHNWDTVISILFFIDDQFCELVSQLFREYSHVFPQKGFFWNKGLFTKSLPISALNSKCLLGILFQKQVISSPVNAFNIPPLLSTSLGISSTLLFLVPLNTKCSIKWLIPLISSDSYSAPYLTLLAVATTGIFLLSWITVNPLSKTFLENSAPFTIP